VGRCSGLSGSRLVVSIVRLFAYLKKLCTSARKASPIRSLTRKCLAQEKSRPTAQADGPSCTAPCLTEAPVTARIELAYVVNKTNKSTPAGRQ
jgi:hypothetical protein